jgi:hypothetical protein
MRRVLHIVILAGLILVPALPGSAQEIRMANGMILKGEVKQATDTGLEIQSPAGPKIYTWETLSSATRFRYQPIYRVNFDAILQGSPPSTRTNKLEAEVTAAQAEAPNPKTIPLKQTAKQPRSLRVFDQAPYENVDSISSSQIPNLQLRTPNSAAYMGLQYGPTKKDVVYMVFDPKNVQDTPDTLLVYSPVNPAYSNAVRLSGFKKSSGGARAMTFKKFKLNSRFGLVMADYEIECAYLEGQTNAITMTISTELYKDNTKNRFLLSGQTSNLIQGDGIVDVKGLLGLPVLMVSLDLTTGSPRLVGNLNMSHLKLAPKEGMENRVWITIIDDKGEVTQRESIKLDESTFAQQYGIVCELKRPEAGKTYVAKAAIDLGPYIGSAVFEEKITIPASAAK